MVLVAAVATPVVVVSAATSAVVVTVAAPVALVVIVAVLMAAGSLFVTVALMPAAAVHLGLRVPIGGAIVPRAAPARAPTCGRLPLRRLGEAAVQLLKLLHVELPHHVVHHDMLLQIIGRWEGPLCVGGGGVRWGIELHRGPLSVGIRCICRTGILRVSRAAAVTAP